MGHRDDRESDVRRLLDELCVKLGFCLPPEERRRLRESPPAGVDGFTDAVLAAEGMSGSEHPDLRRQVREVVERHTGRWRGSGAHAPEGRDL
ncbi:hypothetical protein O7600_10485 [Micromonospora sp. WMMA1998]|uniref:hypothetical protein n=1 Tax=Micromonospora sp. WMMA1998 TaxID=3015167 RepID=UPI00248C25B0|nr:hypothetical protein [Micromonospora sp. WMMA1998]WBC17223.1 hypothetical protein O7600_10485 [Micromonospora sp. WMMA1998]